MNFLDAVKICFTQKYLCFNGRARRREYWFFVLFLFLVNMVLNVLTKISDSLAFLSLLFFLAYLLPLLGVMVRRCHDIGKSGWILLINLIPFIGQLFTLVMFIRNSEPGENNYGPNPKE